MKAPVAENRADLKNVPCDNECFLRKKVSANLTTQSRTTNEFSRRESRSTAKLEDTMVLFRYNYTRLTVAFLKTIQQNLGASSRFGDLLRR
ncbi:hypothetical protein P5673_011333 [Acropora cervicornis]|uniref:Uncharacterized protein n=1 Tax=Acropora cervicornis TaxID=6130 RepID=A0AAD9QQ67_ACRCE|nr:hypothetical protein P5673_011333 [Acropora cervicornis]